MITLTQATCGVIAAAICGLALVLVRVAEVINTFAESLDA